MIKISVLIVEDVRSIQRIWDKVLIDDIFEKSFADDGKEGLRLYKALKPDIILLDVMMPEMTGYSVLKEIRDGIGDKSTTIVMSTTVSDKNDIMECVKLGIQGYIVKPFEEQEAMKKILRGLKTTNPDKAQAAEDLLEKTQSVEHLVEPIPVGKGDSSQESFTLEEYEYMEELKFCLEKGFISDNERRLLNRKKAKFRIRGKRAFELESIVMREDEHHSAQETEYIDELKFCLETGPISDDERKLLDRLRLKLNITEEQSAHFEEQIQNAKG